MSGRPPARPLLATAGRSGPPAARVHPRWYGQAADPPAPGHGRRPRRTGRAHPECRTAPLAAPGTGGDPGHLSARASGAAAGPALGRLDRSHAAALVGRRLAAAARLAHLG